MSAADGGGGARGGVVACTDDDAGRGALRIGGIAPVAAVLHGIAWLTLLAACGVPANDAAVGRGSVAVSHELLTGDVVFDFNDGTTQTFAVGWGGAFAPATSGVEAAPAFGDGALRLDVAFTGGDFDEANAQGWLAGTANTKLDLAGYSSVEYDVYVPDPTAFTGVFKMSTALNDDFVDLSPFTDYGVMDFPRLVVGGVEYAVIHRRIDLGTIARSASGQLVLRFAAWHSTFVGPLFVDNVRIRAGAPLPPPPPQPTQPIVFDFESGGAEGWSVAWGSAFDPAVATPVASSNILGRAENAGSLSVSLAFTGGSFEEANVGAYFEGPGQPVDLSLYESLAYDLYIPDPEAFTGILKVEAALDGPFAEIPPGFSDYSVAAAPRVTIAGVTYAVIHRVVPQDVLADRSPSGKLIIRLAAYASTFHGAIYIDDIRMTPVSGTSVKLLAPDRLATVSGRVGVRARVLSPPDQAVSAVTLIAPGGSRTSMTPTGGSNYQGTWDTTGSPGGLQTVAVEAATAGTTVTSRVEVEVDNTGLRVTLLAPRFDATLTGTAQVRVSVVGATPPASVRAKLGEAATALSLDGEGTYTGAIDTRGLPDGPYTLRVDASTAGAGTDTTARAFVDVMVANAPEHWVTRKKGDFLVDGRPFHYAGFNAYDLPFKYPRTLAAREKTLQYDSDGTPLVTVLEAGTILDERAQVDRELIEARKLGMSVVRTWAFNSDRNDQHAFYTPDWSFSEAQFQRLDYVVDSARRHGLKVILTFENYWSSYGGIAATAARFGVPVLEFFSDARCVQMYRAYIAHLIGRTNSVNGRVYREDPTLFAWELMNEPRMGLSEDGTPDRHLYDPTGARLGTWMSETSAYVKSLDPRHLVSPGSEAHGFEGWGGTADGYGSDPLAVMDQPDIDFFTFHPYLNESWSKFTVGAAKKLVTDFVKAGVARRKPVVMEEWGFNKTESVLDLVGNPILPQDVAYDRVRAAWYKLVLATLRREGGDGSNVWMLQTNLQEPNFGITLFTPFDDALADHGLVSTLSYEANLVRVLGGATYIPDVKRKFTDESGYIYEVSYTGLMPLLPGGRFAPMASATVADLVDALARLGIVTAASCNPGAELDMQTAADLLYAGLQLSAYGSELETLQRFDLLPRSTHGDFKPRRRLERAELAELVIRLSDFLLYR